ncbi:possible thiamine pyrophosphate enzyme [Aurantimonas manganoxydans SI85-9A1]|uniref:Possible thiamine pyrophosphate enzyme n=1 Tax=Aurantimonas manganoxydans (strain ATCC BAA-1229 / DSM 21871 / SI85-9A1) TaxID=287752 RepID=Q1YIT6_AURMS|nr:thiamine pyrophosphate-requiring protein [Aurantimonas manganoxydans]EAS50031.1 possible thiamine pyrophosphate enzyme [Aurantimonas manganoxydans SI85-9A1]
MYTASTAFLEALMEAGVTHLFVNFGSDHPGLIEAIAEARAEGRPVPRVITCPNEMAGMSAAQGFAQVSGQAQAVIVHVECGTQALAGAVHNAARGRVPMLIFAGASPFTQEGEMRGSRNEFIQWIQDVHDQRGIVRGYMKYDNEVRTGRNVKQLVHRAMQFAGSEPRGPVYLMGAREVMEEELAEPVTIDPGQWGALAPAALPEAAVGTILDAVANAERPLVVTSYVGRNREAVPELVRFCERLGIGVLESVPNAMNFPHDHPLYRGNQWNEPRQNAALAEADCVIIIDSDVPWIPTISKPAGDATIIHLDVDPLKEAMPLWYIGARHAFRTDAATALAQLNAGLDAWQPAAEIVDRRSRHHAAASAARREGLVALEAGVPDTITPEFATACVRRHIDADTIVLNEGITNYPVIFNHMRMTEPGSIFTSGGGSLGWNGGAAIGAKLAAPDKTIVAMTGDGSYMFSVPSSVHWMAAKYGTPFVQIVYNNRGWKAPRFSAMGVHPDGYASRADDLDIGFDPPPKYADIAAAAGGAHARRVERPDELEAAVAEAFDMVRNQGRSAVLDVWLASA